MLAACQTGDSVLEVEVEPAASAVQEEAWLAELRPVIQAILGGRVHARRELIAYVTTPCFEGDGFGGPPACADGEPAGTVVEAFPVMGSEGVYLRPAEIDQTLQFAVKGLYAIYRETPNPEAAPHWPNAEYVLLFDRDEKDIPMPVAVAVSAGKIVRLHFHHDITAEQLLSSQPVSQIVLPPAQAQATFPTPAVPTPAPTQPGIDFSGRRPPVDWPVYENRELVYRVQYMPGWMVDESGLTQPTREVTFNPPQAGDFKVALSLSLDLRSLAEVEQAYHEHVPDAVRAEVALAREQGVLYTYPWGRIEIYLPHHGEVYVIATDYGGQEEYLQVVSSFQFID
jgi:hypothetical protein